jgi:uncharacterized protein
MIRLLFRSAALCLAASLVVAAAEAQQAPAGPAPGAVAAAPSASHLAAARELAIVTGVLRVYEAFVPQFGAHVRRNTVTRPEIGKDLDQVLEGLRPELEQEKQGMIEAALRFYTTAFTEPELKEIIAFFKTPAGQKYLQNGGRLVDILAAETQRATTRISEQYMSRIRAEMGKRGHQM